MAHYRVTVCDSNGVVLNIADIDTNEKFWDSGHSTAMMGTEIADEIKKDLDRKMHDLAQKVIDAGEM